MTYENLNQAMVSCEPLMLILSMTDPNQIWNKYLESMNGIINTLIPTKIVQFEKNHVPYITEDVRNQMGT